MRAALAAVVAASLVVAGCGSDDPAPAKRTLLAYARAVEARDGAALCRTLSAESRELLGVLGRARFGSGRCARFMASRLDEGFGGRHGIVKAAQKATVNVDGDRGGAHVRDATLSLAREDGTWTVDLAGTPRTGYALRAGALCSAAGAAARREPLPEATREGYARSAAADAARLERLAAEIDDLHAPELEPERQLVTALRGQAAALRRAGERVARGEPVVASTAAEARALSSAQKAEAEAEKALGIVCYGSVAREPGTERYRREAEDACRSVDLGTLPDPADDLERYMRGVRTAGLRVLAELRQVDPPAPVKSAHRAALSAYAQTLAAIPAIGRAPGAYDEYGLRSLRAATAFSHLSLPACARL